MLISTIKKAVIAAKGEGKMILKDGRITILFDRDNRTTIEIYDGDACIRFVQVTMTNDQVASALSRLGHTPCIVEVRGLDCVGKKREHKSFEFEIPFGEPWHEGYVDRVCEAVKEKCPQGWEPDLSFSSQDSFFDKDGKRWARTTIRRWVDQE